MKRILINATHNEEIRVALCKDNHLYDFDLENRTREQKKSNIYKGHVTRVEPSLEAVFVEYGSARQGFLPLREIAPEYLAGNIRGDNIKQLIKEGDELIIQIEKEERGNKGAAISTYISLAGRYLVLMPNNTKGGGISRQISGKVRDEMRQIIANLDIPKGMSVIVRTAGIGKTYEDLAADLTHLLDTWASITHTSRTQSSPCLLYQEAGVVTRAMRDYLRDDIGEIWIDSEHAYNEAASFISQVMPAQMGKLRKYMDFEPMFVRFGIERQIESAYQREVRLPSGGSIVIDQTEALVSIDINSAKSTKGSDVAETAFHTNLEAADEIARQLRLRDMGGLIVIDFIDMTDPKHQKEVEKRLIDATRYDRARVQFAEISKFGLLEMSRQRLRPSLDESTGYICPRCHGNGMIRDLRSLALSIMRQIEQLALKHRSGEVQAEVPTEIAAFLLNEKRESLVYLEQDSGTRITVLPHAHLESPNFSLHFNPDGFAPASYDRIIDTEEQQNIDRGYDINWQTPEPNAPKGANHWHKNTVATDKPKATKPERAPETKHTPHTVAWLSNLFAPKQEATLAPSLQSSSAAAAIEAIVNTGRESLGALGSITLPSQDISERKKDDQDKYKNKRADKTDKGYEKSYDKPYEKSYDKDKSDKYDKEKSGKADRQDRSSDKYQDKHSDKANKDIKDTKDNSKDKDKLPKRDSSARREPREVLERVAPLTPPSKDEYKDAPKVPASDDKADFGDKPEVAKRPDNKAPEAKPVETKPTETKSFESKNKAEVPDTPKQSSPAKPEKARNPNEVMVRIERAEPAKAGKASNVVRLSLDGSKMDEPTPEVAQTIESPVPSVSSNAAVDSTAANAADNTIGDTAPTMDAVSVDTTTEVASNNTSNDTTSTEKPSQDSAQTSAEVAKTESVVDGNIAHDETQSADAPISHKDDTSAHKDDMATIATKAVSQDFEVISHRLTVGSVPTQELVSPTNAILCTIAERSKRSLNDPRVIKDALKGGAITGTAGAFVNAHLSADELGATSFAERFVRAHRAFTTTQAFNFSNYGYAPLSKEYLQAFAERTAERGGFAISSGKTVPPERTPSARAKNDPRGALVAPAAKTATDTEELPVPATSSAPAVEVVAATAPSATLSELQKTVESLTQTIEELLSMTDSTPSKVEDADGKTTPESYKNMIETIAEQLLPQTGILKLASPKKPAKKATKVAIKIPKADSKPKTEIRKRKKDSESAPAAEPVSDNTDNT